MRDRIKFWITADTHFGHERMLQPDVGRQVGYELSIFCGLDVIRACDVLIHLGDVCIGKDEYWHYRLLKSCRGKKWLIRGNHDKKTTTWYLEHGWDFVAERFDTTAYGVKIAFTHIPIVGDDFDINVHGHLHRTLHHKELLLSPKHALVHCDGPYAPINLRTIVENKQKQRERR